MRIVLAEKLDLLLALIIFIVSGTVLFYQARSIQNSGVDTEPFAYINAGDNNLAVLVEERCAGYLEAKLDRVEVWYIRLKGAIQAHLGPRSIQTNIDGTLIFNQLNQLSRIKFDLTVDHLKINLFSESINPIKLSISAALPEGDFKQELTLPGPVIFSIKDDRGSISHPLLRGMQVPNKNLPADKQHLNQALLQALGLTAQTDPGVIAQCKVGLTGSVDLWPILKTYGSKIKEASKVTGQLNKILGVQNYD
ncbi:hypothetical protein JNK13_10920 [bacterium]|nr:hypothetical protein [bacterium]